MGWLKRLFGWVKTPFKSKIHRPISAIGKLMSRETPMELDTTDGRIRITLKHLTLIESFEVEAQVDEVQRVMKEKGFEPPVISAASRSMRLQMLIFFSCYLDGEKLFSTPEETSEVLTLEQQMKVIHEYDAAFILTEEQRGNWWRERTQVSPT